MLLRFTTADLLNTTLIDVTSSDRAYSIATVEEAVETWSDSQLKPSSSSSWSSGDFSLTPRKRRRTTITDPSGHLIASLMWNGRHPDITIGEEHIGGLTNLFGSSTVRFMPKILVVPTRFDAEYIWTATSKDLTLIDYDSDTVKGTFHQNAVPVPQSFTSFSPQKAKTSMPEQLSSRHSLISTSSTTTAASVSSNNSFIYSGLPGVGSNYLEFDSHPLAHDVEIIISFIMMEILRRGRFSLTPYSFERPKFWQLKEARDVIIRRLQQCFR
ncbi:hypothetical protein AX14_008559 [Amanita brunnescens Koide BX004]|nr:hypothetical protein AX14_008559 [Amanita brunnescens Koide BX004]